MNYEGELFVQGPLNIGRSPQGQPVIFASWFIKSRNCVFRKEADAVFAIMPSLEEAQQYYIDVKEQTATRGRNPQDVIVLQGISPIIGDTEEEAERKYEELTSLVTIEQALAFLGRLFEHHNFSHYPLDESFPDIGIIGENSFRSDTDRIKSEARKQNLTLRQVALREATPRTPFIGTPEQVANLIEAWYERNGADGFMLIANLPSELETFVDKVVPILQKRGIFPDGIRRDYITGEFGVALCGKPIFT